MDKTFEQRVVTTWGQQGNDWLQQLPSIQAQLATCWNLSDITPVTNMNYHFVAWAKQGTKQVIVKISCLLKESYAEYRALQHFRGNGSVNVLDFNQTYHALLLEAALPGHALKTQSLQFMEIVSIYADLVNTLASIPAPNGTFTHVSHWCEAIDHMQETPETQPLLELARPLKQMLLDSMQDIYLCHGDLHLENIIQYDKHWVTIDPKGIIGERAFEAAAFDLLRDTELQQGDNLKNCLHERGTQLAAALELPLQRLWAWFFIRLLISAQWFIEDNDDPGKPLQIAKLIFPYLKNSN